GVGAVVFVLPQEFAVGFVQTQDAFAAGNAFAGALRERLLMILGPFCQEPIGHINLAPGHSGSGIPSGDRTSPDDSRPTVGELIETPASGPAAVALGAEPLRPVVGAGQRV